MKRNDLTKDPTIAFLGILFGLVCFGSPLAAQEIVSVLDNDHHADSHTTQQHADALLSITVGASNAQIGLGSLSSYAGGYFNEVLGAGLPLPNTSVENTATGTGLVNTILSLFALPWIVRALASGNAIWRAVKDGNKRKGLKG
jgi:hypothetical protein